MYMILLTLSHHWELLVFMAIHTPANCIWYGVKMQSDWEQRTTNMPRKNATLPLWMWGKSRGNLSMNVNYGTMDSQWCLPTGWFSGASAVRSSKWALVAVEEGLEGALGEPCIVGDVSESWRFSLGLPPSTATCEGHSSDGHSVSSGTGNIYKYFESLHMVSTAIVSLPDSYLKEKRSLEASTL